MLAQVIDTAYTVSGFIMLIFYVPQLIKVIKTPGSLEGVSLLTFSAWAVCLFTAFLYGSMVTYDNKFAIFSLAGSFCCVAIIIVTALKRYRSMSFVKAKE